MAARRGARGSTLSRVLSVLGTFTLSLPFVLPRGQISMSIWSLTCLHHCIVALHGPDKVHSTL